MLTMSARLRLARTAAKLSQAALADRLRINRRAVAQWEQSAGTSPNIANLSQVAEATGVCFEWLATGRGPTRPEGNEFDVAVRLRDYAHNELETHLLELFRGSACKKPQGRMLDAGVVGELKLRIPANTHHRRRGQPKPAWPTNCTGIPS